MAVRQQILKNRRFHDLMPFRVREVLLVSSPYDAFILEEDGQLTEQVFFEYRDVSLTGPPRVTHVSSSEVALQRLEEQRFDLVLVMTSLAGLGVNDFGRRVKELPPGRPVAFLALDRKELDRAADTIDPKSIDATFLWTGDSQILLAIFKYFEDRENVDHDIQHGNVRVILLVEDSPRYYSSLLGMLYKELMSQSHSLYTEGVNELHRRMYMRSRPKILHATTYEQGVELFERYKHHIMGVVSDVRIPHHGELAADGGIQFAGLVRKFDPDLPLLLESAEQSNAERAKEVGASFVDKNSDRLLAEIRSFIRTELGFGEFVFRDPQDRVVGRAQDVRELERQLAVIPEESLVFHASHNHFSMWLMARSEFELAERLRPRTISDFPSVEALREYLIELLRETRRKTHLGVVADFSRKYFDRDLFSRIDQGALGGKARGIAFLNLSLSKTSPEDFGGLEISVPKTVVITTDRFDHFMEDNDLGDFAYACDDDREIARRFLEARLSDSLRSDLTFIAHQLAGPLAIRSSSLLEDSLHQPLAGIYSTLMIPNLSRDPDRRLAEICSAVQLVYASTFFSNAKAYLGSTANRVEEERMAVIVQPLVGRRHGPRFYPTFGGIAQSHNFYPIGPQRPEDGVVHVALGLGRYVVEGGLALRFSPRHPEVLPHELNPKLFLKNSQRDFFALDLEDACCGPDVEADGNVRRYALETAEEDGTLVPVASVYSMEDDAFRDDLAHRGARVITFNNILKHRAVPLAKALRHLLEIGEESLGCPVEIEFACEMGDWGRPPDPGRAREKPVLYPLQLRPFAATQVTQELRRMEVENGETLCSSSHSLGHIIDEEIRDVVFVRRDGWDASANKAIAREVETLNRKLGGEDRPYLLIGPGRWGTADPWLGIPVQWGQISNVRILVEASPAGYDVEPSQGTHFFQNITSLRIGYLTLPPGSEAREGVGDDFIDWRWLESQPAATETAHLRHLRFSIPLTAFLDGRKSRGVILKPRADR